MKDKFLKLIRVILVIVIAVCLGILGRRGYDYYKNYKNNQHIASVMKEVKANDKSGKKIKIETFADKEKKFMEILKKFQKENQDVIGFIEIPETNIAYPILQAKDNNYYLRQSLDLKYDIAGSIFMDYMNDSKFNDANSVIYGHYVQGMETMFSALKKFRDQDFATKNRKIYITTNEGLREYEIFSVFTTPSEYDYRTLDFEDMGQKLEYFKKLRDKSDVSLKNREFKEDDTIITLSTCQYDYEDERLAVHALRVR